MMLIGYRLQSTTNRNLFLLKQGKDTAYDWKREADSTLFDSPEAKCILENFLNAGVVLRLVPIHVAENGADCARLLSVGA